MMHATAARTEYAIYLFDHPAPRQKSDCRWMRHATLFDEAAALIEAKTLYRSRKYAKIEVKKKFYDPGPGRIVDVSLKVFGGRGVADMLGRAKALLGLSP